MTSPRSADLARLERRLHRRIDARARARRLWFSLPVIVQLVVAVAISYSIAHFGLGHPYPLLSVTVAINALGFARDARPRKLVETIFGMFVGILLADLLVVLFGVGFWQLIVAISVTLVIARVVAANPSFAIAAAVQCALVVLLPLPVGGPFARTLDAAIASVIALLVTALVPRDPRGAALREARALYSVLVESAETVADALKTADSAAGELALNRLRRTQTIIDDWTTSLETALSVSRIAPLLRRHLPELRAQTRLLTAADLTSRHLRPLARRVEFLVRDGRARPALAAVVGEVATGIRLLGDEVSDREWTGAARSLLTDLAGRLDPAIYAPDGDVVDSTIIVMLRPLVVDLLTGAGMDADAARDLLPHI